MIAERAPGLGQLGLEMHRAPQRRDGLVALPEPAERQARQRQRVRLVRMHLEDLRGLLGRGRARIALEQSRRVSQRHLERAQRLRGVSHD